MRRLLSLAVVALALTACGSQKPSASPSPAASPAAGDVIVRAGHIDQALRAVARGPLSERDRRLFAAFMAQNRNRTDTYDGQTVRRIINFQIAYDYGLRDVAQAKAREELYKKQIEPLLDARVLSGKDAHDRIVFTVLLHNKTAKALDHVDLGVDIYDATTKGPIGHIELNLDRKVAAHGSVTFAVPVHYALFDADAGMMMGAAQHRKTFVVSPTAVEFANGSGVGEESD